MLTRAAGRDELGLGRAFKVGPAEREAALEAAVLVEDDPRRDQRRPGQMVGEPVGAAAVFGEVQHARCPCWRRCRASTGAKSGSRLAANTASAWPTAQRTRPGDPLLEAEAERRGERAVDDREPARRAAEQDRLGQRAVDRRFEAFDVRPAPFIRPAPRRRS